MLDSFTIDLDMHKAFNMESLLVSFPVPWPSMRSRRKTYWLAIRILLFTAVAGYAPILKMSLSGSRILVVVAVCYCLIQCVKCAPLEGSRDGSAKAKDPEDLCSVCLEVVTLVQHLVDSNATLNDILPLAERVCEYALGVIWKYVGTYMCPGLIRSYVPVVQYVLSREIVDPHEICGALHLCKPLSHDDRGSPLFRRISKHIESLMKEHSVKREFNNKLQLPSSSLRYAELEQYSVRTGTHEETHRRRSGVKLGGNSSTVTFLQLTDIHFDKKYAEGSHPHCHLYLCCRSWYNGTGSAGHYGAYECDLPMATLELVIDTVKKLDPQPDFIIFTGDNPPHEIWNETFSSQLESSHFVIDYLAQQLPNAIIYPTMGNHETWPQSEYLGSLADYQNLTKTLAHYWMKFVDLPPEAVTTIIKGGYYSMNITDKLRLISFNSNYGYAINFYTFLNDQDPSIREQNDWIMEQLTQAEQAGQKVLVISHIPPGSVGNHAAYGEFYLNMTRQFSEIIVGHLFGHTHMDEIELVQDADGVYGTVLVAPSVTPYGFMNPSFRVFTMDADTLQLLGYQQYHLNLTKANELASQNIIPEFELVYNTAEEYGLKDLSPQSYADLVERFASGESSTELDHYHYNIHGRSMFFEETCGDICKWETLCTVNNVISTDVFKCLAKL